MSYLAIARKWRPTTFDTIAGQRHVTRTLANAIRMGRIHHAFLFTGPRGVGKTTAARALARALECVQGPTAEPCGVCDLCTNILSGTCPDVIEIDGASNNSVDDVRDLRESVRYLPSLGRYRIYIIDEVHMLTRGAFNALLKTLEEPPPHVIFIFATTEVQKIPETILSRVQRFDFKRIPVAVVAGKLQEICEAEGVEISPYALRVIAAAGEGSMRDSQSLLDQVISFSGVKVADDQVVSLLGLVDRSILYAMLEGLIRARPELCLDAIERIHDYGYELTQFTGELLELLRNAALVALSPDAARYVDLSADEVERIRGLSEGLGAEVFSRWFDALAETHEEITRSSRPRLVLEMAVARLTTIRPARSMDQLVARLEDLERRLRARGATGERGPTNPHGASSPPRSFDGPRGPTSPTPGSASRSAPIPSEREPSKLKADSASEAVEPGKPARTQEQVAAGFNAFLDGLSGLQGGWELDADHVAFGALNQDTLTVLLPTEFRLNQLREKLKHTGVLDLASRHLFGVRRVEGQLRDPARVDARTRHEVRQAREAKRVEALQAEVQRAPFVAALAARLGAEIDSIHEINHATQE